tara:strand:- start:2286 stop:3989 length:1704 start_codon:yes stop_codon:yes gene_type:complete
MAVVQISRIQVRRGQKNAGTGVPQLASGEFGWAVDARELYIGNGAVSEGSPQVGNTKVLTQYDNIFDLADAYTYRSPDAWMNTGGVGATAITRTLQDRLDDRVSGRAFGLTGETTQIATTKLQNAIDQLYLNDANKGSIGSRVVLYLEAGEYIVDDTIYIPPYTNIVGAGSDKTVIRTSTLNKPIFQTVNDSSTVGTPSSHASTTTINQPRDIHITGITLESTVVNFCMILDSCKDSMFEDVKFKGNWSSGDAISNSDVGLQLNNLSSTVETKNNSFKNCKFSNISYAVQSDWDTNNNNWHDCEFFDLGYGIGFGTNLLSLDLTSGSGKNTGPRDNLIAHCYFHDIDRQAIWAKFGVKNFSEHNKFDLCGNSGSADNVPSHSVIKFERPGNVSKDDIFSRTAVLSYDASYWDGVKYIPEIEGAVDASFGQVHVLNTITRTGIDTNPAIGIIHQKRFRVPAEDDVANQRYDIDYVITSRNYDSFRSGILTINVNGITKTVTVEDNQNFTGTTSYQDAISFDVLIQDADGDTVDDSIDVRVGSIMPSDDVSQIEYKVKLRKTIVDATGE